MSQKSGRRVRKHNSDDSDPDFKPPSSVKLVVDEPKPDEPLPEENGAKTDGKIETNGNDINKDDQTERVTRSRSNTPLKKKKNDINEEEIKIIVEEKNQNSECVQGVVGENNSVGKQEESKNGTIGVETNLEECSDDLPEVMDPLVLFDDPDPELQFDENSDGEVEISEKESPVLARCTTRRSQTRNIPTPKTPKAHEEVDDEKNERPPANVPEIDLNSSFESASENFSTNAEVGGDSTRQEFVDDNNDDDSSFLNQTKNKTLAETLRGLSTRRTIRPICYDYRKRALTNNFEKSDLNATYPLRNSIERISMGVKRKGSAESMDDCKRFKQDSPGLISRLTSPLTSIRNKFKSDIPPSSTPKLTGYRDAHLAVGADVQPDQGQNKWCSIM